jgi:DNA-directed RNA polymerase subunit RPC12/RpoP
MLAAFTLKRTYRCLKCDKVMLGSIFLERRAGNRDKPSKIKCPQCGETTHRSRRSAIERIIPYLRAYRCSKCDSRFRRFSRA